MATLARTGPGQSREPLGFPQSGRGHLVHPLLPTQAHSCKPMWNLTARTGLPSSPQLRPGNRRAAALVCETSPPTWCAHLFDVLSTVHQHPSPSQPHPVGTSRWTWGPSGSSPASLALPSSSEHLSPTAAVRVHAGSQPVFRSQVRPLARC